MFKRKFLALLTIGILASCGMAHNSEQAKPTIYGGAQVAANSNDARYFATVALTTAALRAQGHSFCSGTLIAYRTVMTAAHCVTSANGQPPVSGQILISFGNRVGAQSQVRRAVQIIPHPQYRPQLTTQRDPSLPPNDIALITLDTPAPQGFRPVQIYQSDVPQRGHAIHIAGFGLSRSSANNDTGVLRADKVKYLQLQAGEHRFDTNTLFHGTCPGDSGGPAYVVSNGMVMVYGITSTGRTLNLPGLSQLLGECFTGFNTFTDARYYVLWLMPFLRN